MQVVLTENTDRRIYTHCYLAWFRASGFNGTHARHMTFAKHLPHSAPSVRSKALVRILDSRFRMLRRTPLMNPLPGPGETDQVETFRGAPALFETDQLGRILSCGFKRSLESEIAKLEATCLPCRGLTEHVLEDVIIAGGQILAPGARYFLGSGSPLRALQAPLRRFDTATLVNSQQGLKYFGHWLRDDCAAFEALREEPNLISMRRPDWPDGHVYEAAFGQAWDEVEFAHVGRLSVHRELGFNPDKARRIGRLRQKLRAAHSPRNAGRIVYIGRGAGGEARDMSNRKEMETAFDAAGIRIVRPEAGSGELIENILDADMIITVEGSQAAHGVYTLADGGALLILQPPERFYNPHHEWTQLLGMRYGITIGEKDEISYRIYPDDVFRMIDRLLAAPRHSDA